ncbi:MAG: NAD(P)-dependent glycerol-3-phosphate dehydrogenase [Alphaproteobacteria bacterium]|nr:MAG: NAD(P)-dependent glycerol-3-phosphate dehydrogenase [Alphaproteobacteria bacterium]
MEGNRIAVLGAGSWGTALAMQANRAGSDVTLWVRDSNLEQMMRTTRINTRYLPNQFIDPAITITHDLDVACAADVLILAVPSQALRTLCITLADRIDESIPMIIASKGIERGSFMLMSEVLESTLTQNPIVILSGPNFAIETAQGLPTATVLASRDRRLAERIQFMLSGHVFRPYISDDVMGVQVGGAIKNVIAIACGMTIGANLGENARAAVMTRGLAEMARLAEVKGGQSKTLQGLAGIGDLMLSCASEQSRNMRLGMQVGKHSIDGFVPTETVNPLTEGVSTAEAVYDLSMKLGISMPISVVVCNILRMRMSVQEGMEELLSRPLGFE